MRSKRLVRALQGLGICAAVLVTTVVSWFFYCESRNSRDVPMPSEAEIRASFKRASGWIFANSARISSENNAILWLYVRNTGHLVGDTHLLELADAYQARYAKGTVLQFLFDSRGSEQLTGRKVKFDENWQDYQRLFVYGATCNDSAREDPQVLALLSPAACDRDMLWLRSPWCRTHQLMGLHFVQQNHCEPDVETTQTVATVQNSILTELRWDFRVEDAYIQKVLTLVESGRRKDIKPIWIKQILDAQRPDGGWDGVQVLAQLPAHRILAWSDGRLYPTIRFEPATNLHATAQSLYLLALLLQPDY